MSNKQILGLFLCGFAFVASRAKPLPPVRVRYTGRWEGPNIVLQIAEDSQVHYEKRDNGSSTKIDMPIREFNGNDFTVGFGPIATTFVVSQVPTQKNGKWVMTVDGIELTKTQQ